jgi:DNA-binding MarR family transcriptional regulator
MAHVTDDVRRLLDLYPRIYFACHQRHRRDAATGEQLSGAQASILDHLDEVEPTLVGRLAEHMGVTASTMSLALDRLERGGYICRQRDQRDRRRVGVTLTEAGARMKQAASVLEPGLVERLLQQLPAPDRKAALHGLGLLAQASDALIASKSRTGSETHKGDG